ncbi:hypothetical protein KHC24_22425 [Ancylobacter defluvii]|nr:hypothetical protein [Ancylobacter defluvii]
MSNTEQLRHDIDRGRGGDKVPFPDPAAAPLGTDDEAAGTTASSERVELARNEVLHAGAEDRPGVTHESSWGFDDNRGGTSPLPFVARVALWLGCIVIGGGSVAAWLVR